MRTALPFAPPPARARLGLLLSLLLCLAAATPAAAGSQLLASTLLGAGSEDEVTDTAVAPDGSVYVVGWTESVSFPTTPDAFDLSLGGERDAFVARLSPDLTTVLAATFLGGEVGDGVGTWDGAEAVVVTADAVWITGFTYTPDFPVTSGAYDTENPRSATAFVARMSPDLTAVEAATYLGEGDTDLGLDLALAADGDVYVTGFTLGTEFPTTPDAYDRMGGPFGDVFVSRLSADLASLETSTLVANGSGSEIALAADGDVFVAGGSSSPDYPTTPDAYDRTCGTDGLCDPGPFVIHSDTVLSRLDADLTTLEASTYLGHDGDDGPAALALDGEGGVYVSGTSSSSAFPTTPDAYQRDSNGFNVIFASRLDRDLTTLEVSTLLGGFEPLSGSEGFDMLLGPAGVYVTGETFADDFPTTPDALDDRLDGANDVIVSILDRELGTLVYSTLLGGPAGPQPEEDRGRSIALATDGTLYAAGHTVSPDFPTTPGAFQEEPTGGFDGFVSRLDLGAGAADLAITLTPFDPPIVIPPEGGSFGYTVEITNLADEAQEVDFWRQLETPGGDTLTAPARSLTVPADTTVSATLSQSVPGGAPAGSYTFTGLVGSFPVAEASDGFGFEKSEAAAGPVLP